MAEVQPKLNTSILNTNLNAGTKATESPKQRYPKQWYPWRYPLPPPICLI